MARFFLYDLLTVILIIGNLTVVTSQSDQEKPKLHILYIRHVESRWNLASAVAKGKTQAPLLNNINIGKYQFSTKWAPKTLRRWGGKAKAITQGLHKDSKVSDKGKQQLQDLYDDFGKKVLKHEKFKKIFEDGHFHFECMYLVHFHSIISIVYNHKILICSIKSKKSTIISNGSIEKFTKLCKETITTW